MEKCKCNGQYYTSECDVIYNPDNTCHVTSRYEYKGVCDDKTMAPTAAPTPLPCPDKECKGQNPVVVFKGKYKCDPVVLNKFCLKAKITAKMNADLECNIADKCLCQGKFTSVRCFSVPVNKGPLFKPYCYYYAKYKYEGKCGKSWITYPGLIADNAIVVG
jgi:hypothetical protein